MLLVRARRPVMIRRSDGKLARNTRVELVFEGRGTNRATGARLPQEKIANLNQCPREPDVSSPSSAALAEAVSSTGHPALGVGCCCCTDAHLACSCETSDSILSASSACGSAEPE